MLVYVSLGAFAGVVVFGALFIIMGLKGGPWKLPGIGMVVCFLALVASVVLPGFLGGEDPSTADEPSKAVESEGADEGEADDPDGIESAATVGKEEIEEQVLLDEKGILITAKSLDKEGIFGANLKVLIENNSQENVTVQARNSSVNGYMVDTMFSSDVAAGKKANDAITFVSSDLEACGIESIADMELSFHIFNEDWDTVLDSNSVVIKTALADTYSYRYDDSGEVLYSEDGVRIVSKGFDEYESIFGPGLCLFIENTTGKDVTVQTRDVSVNGFMVNTIFSEDVCEGKRAVAAVTIMNSSLEENGINDIRSMELSFHVFDTDSWETIFDTAPITITE